MSDEQVPRFVTGGTVGLHSPAYVGRPFEEKIYSELTSGHWVLLLGPRQHGKSSALVRLYDRLAHDGYTCAWIDLQRYGGDESYAAVLRWLGSRVASEVGTGLPELSPEAQEDLESWLEAVIPPRFANVAILIDEVGRIPLAHRERFFGQLRALYNSRATSGPESLANRVVFTFAGTFRPEQMITSENSPFNVSVWVYSEDLTQGQAEDLAVGVLGEEGRDYAVRAYAEVGGQPYLLQTLLAAVQREETREARAAAMSAQLEALRAGGDRHLLDVLSLVRGDQELAELAGVLATASVTYVPSNTTHLFAIVSGIARLDGEHLVIRNPLYRFGLQRERVPGAKPPPALEPLGPETCDVVIVTATDVETSAVREVFAAQDAPVLYGTTNTYRDLGVHGGARVALVRAPEMGAGGVGGATLTINDAVKELEPSSVILAGIAFGMEKGKQKIGDTLCATRVIDYELVKVGTDDEGGNEVRPRGVNVPTSARLLGRFQDADTDIDMTVHFGPLLSGDKLIDSVDLRDELRTLSPDAVGGEMEARGGYAAADRAKVDWIVVKAICDWADGKKRYKKAMRQALAANNAAQFVRATLELGGFRP